MPKKGHLLTAFAVGGLPNSLTEPNKATTHPRRLGKVLLKEMNVQASTLTVRFWSERDIMLKSKLGLKHSEKGN